MKTLIRQALISLYFGITLFSITASANSNVSVKASEEEAEVAEVAEVARETSVEENNNGGFLKVGIGYKYQKSPYLKEVNGLAVFLSGRYQWHGLFYELKNDKNELYSGSNFGYNFYNIKQWSFDVNVNEVMPSHHWWLPNKDQWVEVKRADTQMVGLRATGNFEQTSVQISILPYSLNDEYDDGLYASFWLDRFWQLKNWQLNAALGLTYRSAEIIDHYYGIPKGQEIEGLDYKASSGVDVTAQVGVSYPISESWIFDSYLRYTDIADSITDSPINQRTSQLSDRQKNVSEFGILFSYVF